MGVESVLDAAAARVRRSPLLLRFTVITRVLLAVGFLAPGLVKLLGHRFVTTVGDDVVSTFFEVLYSTGPYWRFLGATQVLAAVLVIVPRTAALGTLLFFGIMLNVFLITVSLPFGNTAIVTGLMLGACVFLVCREFPLWKPLLFPSTAPATATPCATLARNERRGFGAVVAGGWLVTLVTRSLVPTGITLVAFWAGLVLAGFGSVVVLASWVRAWRDERSENLIAA